MKPGLAQAPRSARLRIGHLQARQPRTLPLELSQSGQFIGPPIGGSSCLRSALAVKSTQAPPASARHAVASAPSLAVHGLHGISLRSRFALREGCCLTVRSSGPPPAWHLGREAVLSIIVLAAQAPRRWRPLSSNVRQHSNQRCLSSPALRQSPPSPIALASGGLAR